MFEVDGDFHVHIESGIRGFDSINLRCRYLNNTLLNKFKIQPYPHKLLTFI